MLMILSPAKTFKQQKGRELKSYKPLRFSEDTSLLVENLQSYKVEDLMSNMSVSDKLAQLNYERYQSFNETGATGEEAIYYFYGEAYKGVDAITLSKEAEVFMEGHLRILSGLYGILQPLDIIQAYRLEMGSRWFQVEQKSLYEFWQSKLTKHIIETLEQVEGEKVLLDLASEEYSKVLDLEQIKMQYPVVQISFREYKQGTYKIVGMYAKKARGMMVRHICESQIKTLEEIKAFDKEGYVFNTALSNETSYVFTRD